MSLPYRPNPWYDSETGEPTPLNMARERLRELANEELSNTEIAHILMSEFSCFRSIKEATYFVWRFRLGDLNHLLVLWKLKQVRAAKARDLKVIRRHGYKNPQLLSLKCVRRHLARARREGFVTIDQNWVWRLTEKGYRILER